MAKLEQVEGIGPAFAAKLRKAGIKTTESLLKNCCTPKGRKALEGKSGISGKLLLEWTNHVDLFRVKGVGEEYADLLEAAGVDTVPELATRNTQNLLTKIQQVNAEKRLVRRAPTLSMIEDWVAQAKQLPRVIEY